MAQPHWSDDPVRLERSIAWAVEKGFAPADLLPMVERLLRVAPRGSRSWVFAHRQLAELVLESHPWRAAAAARVVAQANPEDDSAHGLLGLALTVLGHYRSAAHAYRAALALAPENPWYAHNLGHLLDAKLSDLRGALHWLQRAFAAEPHPEIGASLAQALGRAGQPERGLVILRKGLKGEAGTPEHQALEAWLKQGAPRRAPQAR